MLHFVILMPHQKDINSRPASTCHIVSYSPSNSDRKRKKEVKPKTNEITDSSVISGNSREQ